MLESWSISEDSALKRGPMNLAECSQPQALNLASQVTSTCPFLSRLHGWEQTSLSLLRVCKHQVDF